MIDIEEFRRLHGPTGADDPLLHGLKNDELADLLNQIVADRQTDLPCDIDLDDRDDLRPRHERRVRDS